jgi:uncharacterized protein YjbI with pentapeptide repeats
MPLHYADLANIDFFCANLTRANFTGAKNFSEERMKGANTQEIILPNGEMKKK